MKIKLRRVHWLLIGLIGLLLSPFILAFLALSSMYTCETFSNETRTAIPDTEWDMVYKEGVCGALIGDPVRTAIFIQNKNTHEIKELGAVISDSFIKAPSGVEFKE